MAAGKEWKLPHNQLPRESSGGSAFRGKDSTNIRRGGDKLFIEQFSGAVGEKKTACARQGYRGRPERRESSMNVKGGKTKGITGDCRGGGRNWNLFVFPSCGDEGQHERFGRGMRAAYTEVHAESTCLPQPWTQSY